eukprot:7217213-Pyramimonas_sp.AAC.1
MLLWLRKGQWATFSPTHFASSTGKEFNITETPPGVVSKEFVADLKQQLIQQHVSKVLPSTSPIVERGLWTEGFKTALRRASKKLTFKQ